MKIVTLRVSLMAALMCAGLTACDEEDGVSPEDQANETDTGTDDPLAPVPNPCEFTEAVTIGDADADGMVRIPPNHPDIFYMGRVDCADPEAPAFAFPGVSIRIRFEGTAVDMLFRDNGNASHINYYNIIIDDGEPEVLEMSPDQERYELARGLEDGEHTLEVFKRVESLPGAPGKGELLGFRIEAGMSLLPVTERPLRMEFIGDSITCGYGNEISTDTPDDFPYTTENSNAYKAYGAVTARILDAEYMAVAYSGRGMVRNYGGEFGDTLPEMYLDTIPEDSGSTKWHPEWYVPDLVVINLGTNDFSEGLEDDIDGYDAMREDFRATYIEFLETLRGYYPDAVIVAAIGPMISNSWPPGYNALTSIYDDVTEAVTARQDAGDDGVYMINFPTHGAPYGEDWHPTAETHQEMADALVAFLDEEGLF